MFSIEPVNPAVLGGLPWAWVEEGDRIRLAVPADTPTELSRDEAAELAREFLLYVQRGPGESGHRSLSRSRRLVLQVREKVSVAVDRGRDLLVSQASLDDGQRDAGCNEPGDVRVPQVVNAGVGV